MHAIIKIVIITIIVARPILNLTNNATTCINTYKTYTLSLNYNKCAYFDKKMLRLMKILTYLYSCIMILSILFSFIMITSIL